MAIFGSVRKWIDDEFVAMQKLECGDTGFFRRHKASRHTREECEGRIENAKEMIVSHVRNHGHSRPDEFDALLKLWAEWRELLARLDGDNHGREQ